MALAAMVLVTTVALPGQAKEGYLGAIKARGKLIVGTCADYPPFESVDDNGLFVGFDMALVREIAKRLGLGVEIRDMLFDALIAAVQNRQIDIAAAAMQGTAERDKAVDFSVPYNFVKDAFVISDKVDVQMALPEDAAGVNIGVREGSPQEIWIRKNLIGTGLTKDGQLSTYSRADTAGEDLSAGRIDLLLIPERQAKDLTGRMKNLKIALVTTKTVTIGQCLALPKGETSLKTELDRVIGDLDKEGWLEGQKTAFGLD